MKTNTGKVSGGAAQPENMAAVAAIARCTIKDYARASYEAHQALNQIWTLFESIRLAVPESPYLANLADIGVCLAGRYADEIGKAGMTNAESLGDEFELALKKIGV